MLTRIDPDGQEFATHLESIDDRQLLTICGQLVLTWFEFNRIDPNDYRDMLDAMGGARTIDTEELKSQIDALDDLYDVQREAFGDRHSSELDAIEALHRKARALSILLYGVNIPRDRRNAHECIYEAMHGHKEVRRFYVEIGRMFGFQCQSPEPQQPTGALKA